ncbi:alpha/beta fold hydrolase [Roseomonas sp. BN140053]|uniref:alpha/beta fold hydrolase n=1 Tax=Roseomonas sp. BN140053 TaxID=3391898 RepID=UPI0039ED5F77
MSAGPAAAGGASPSLGEVVVDGARLETAWWGPGPEEAPTLVLLHEGVGCIALWRGFPAALAAATGCGVLAWSRRGYGQSDPVPLPRPLDYMQREARDAVGPVLDAAGVRRAVLLGHSDGGSIAAIYAGTHQDFRVRGLVLLAPHFVVEAVTIAGIEDARRRYETTDLRNRLARYHADVDGAFWGWNRAWLDPGFRAFNIEAEVAHLRVPVLILQGDADPYGTAEQLRLAQREAYCPVDGVVLPGVGHAPHLEAPEATLGAVAAFLDRLREHGEFPPGG